MNPYAIMFSTINGVVFFGLIGILRWSWARMKKSLETYSNRAIEHHFEKKTIELERINSLEIEKFKGNIEGELEGLKAGYKKVVDENQIRFSRMHEDQVQAIRELYKRIAKVHSTALQMTSLVKLGDEKSIAETDKRLVSEFRALFLDGLNYFDENRIFLSPQLATKVETWFSATKSVFVGHTLYDGHEFLCDLDKRDCAKWKMEASDKARTGVTTLLRDLEDEFRRIYGFISSEHNSPRAEQTT